MTSERHELRFQSTVFPLDNANFKWASILNLKQLALSLMQIALDHLPEDQRYRWRFAVLADRVRTCESLDGPARPRFFIFPFQVNKQRSVFFSASNVHTYLELLVKWLEASA